LLIILLLFLSACAVKQTENLVLPKDNGNITASSLATKVMASADEVFYDQWDLYAAYFTPEEYKAFIGDIIGSYAGIGVYMYENSDTLRVTVLSVMKNTPAAKAGIMAGDEFIKVGSTDVIGVGSDALADLVRGEAGTKVELTMYRKDKGNYTVTLTREIIEVPTVEGLMLNDNMAYIAISRFTDYTADDFLATWLELSQNNKLEGLVLDLRQNPGGEMVAALDIADYFVPKDEAIMWVLSSEEETKYTSQGKLLNVPTTVLQDNGSASASEILLGAIQDNKTGVTIGTCSYGKGIIQTVRALKSGAGLRTTTAKYLTSARRNIHGTGLEPDILCELPEDVEPSVIYSMDPEKDPQLKKAMEVLAEMIAKNK